MFLDSKSTENYLKSFKKISTKPLKFNSSSGTQISVCLLVKVSTCIWSTARVENPGSRTYHHVLWWELTERVRGQNYLVMEIQTNARNNTLHTCFHECTLNPGQCTSGNLNFFSVLLPDHNCSNFPPFLSPHSCCTCSHIFFSMFLSFFGHPTTDRVPGPGIRSEPQLQPMLQLGQCQIFNPLC